MTPAQPPRTQSGASRLPASLFLRSLQPVLIRIAFLPHCYLLLSYSSLFRFFHPKIIFFLLRMLFATGRLSGPRSAPLPNSLTGWCYATETVCFAPDHRRGLAGGHVGMDSARHCARPLDDLRSGRHPVSVAQGHSEAKHELLLAGQHYGRSL